MGTVEPAFHGMTFSKYAGHDIRIRTPRRLHCGQVRPDGGGHILMWPRVAGGQQPARAVRIRTRRRLHVRTTARRMGGWAFLTCARAAERPAGGASGSNPGTAVSARADNCHPMVAAILNVVSRGTQARRDLERALSLAQGKARREAAILCTINAVPWLPRPPRRANPSCRVVS